MPLDRHAQITLKRLAGIVEDLRRSGLPATLNVKNIRNEASKNGKSFTTEKVDATIKVEGLASIPCGPAFEKADGTGLQFASMASLLSSCLGGAIGLFSFSLLSGAGVGFMAVPTVFLAYRALKTRSLSTAFQDAADLVMERQHPHETRAEILHDIAQELVRYAGDEKSLTLTPQDITPTLTEIIRYAGTQGVRVDVILPNSGKTAQVEYKPAQTLANIVEQIAPPSIPALPKPHPEQGKWANGLSASFNRLSNAITALEPELRNTAQPLIKTAKAVQTLCVEIAIANSRIGKVTQELDNVSEQVEAYAQMKRFGIARAEDQDALTKVFEVKTASIAERFVPDLAAVRHSFEDRFKLLEKDYI